VDRPHDALTERVNERTRNLDLLPVLDQARLMNEEDHGVPDAVAAVLPQVAAAIIRIADALRAGGRLFYVGAGTSGRLGALDAAECPPTFSTAPEQIQAVIAGGPRALAQSVEGSEDDGSAGAAEMDARRVGPGDVVVGISASGETPFVIGAVERARIRGAVTIGLACSVASPLEAACEIAIVPLVGAEVIAGSTRLKAGTAQKMVLNMLSTLSMVRIGKVYGNLMVDLAATNTKLRRRAARIVAMVTGAGENAALLALDRSQSRVPVAIVMLGRGVDVNEAETLLDSASGNIRRVLEGSGG
jgi:N-acetylmuramic acid 6-phosphate etherase